MCGCEKLITLEVGCGNLKMGNVNVDLDRKVKPDIVCSIHNLPFPDSLFDSVFCRFVLEHKGVKPNVALRELLRVSARLVQIEVPHFLGSGARKDKDHANFEVMTNKFWNRLGACPEIVPEYFLKLPFLLKPYSIRVTLSKKGVVH